MSTRNADENYIFHAIERSVRKHIQQIVDEEAQLAHARVQQRLLAEVDKVALSILSEYSVRQNGQEIIITVKKTQQEKN